ncbi:MAG: valine--tRNA ligase [Gammaproteobacteria bacterium]|nr:valine--tRNA ligase [Gammaproteobacteria bacterium]
MNKTYEPGGIEARWYASWERNGYFKPSGSGRPYCIMLPPPNVTGSLHMGHAFQQTLMDILVRFHRMQGHNTLWQCGTDHAGIATQMVVERQLEQQGKSRVQLGRERFEDAVWDWKETSGSAITSQSRRLGTSMDWTRERFTMDPGLSHAVQEVFIHLYEQGLIYRGQRLVNWDPVLHTAISDLEVVSEEETGRLWHLRYPLSDGSGHLVVATTRPETMLGDTAVAVNPGDDRYRHLVGKEVNLPLAGRRIPVIADEHVDPEFGTGCVKITPGHDFNDYAVGQRHNLPIINLFTIDAALNENAPAGYRGLDRFAAREKIVSDLKAAGLLDRTETHKLVVPRGDRSGAVIEPYLTNQWYVKIAPLAAPAIRAVEDGRIRFAPENWAKTYFEWMRNIQDWCISRQLWWGHRIPAWFDDTGGVHVGRSEEEIRARRSFPADAVLTRDPDVLDTWFSSALWPFSTLGWPQQTVELKTFYPTSVLVTGFDIIFFWVARMIMMGIRFMDEVPFREVYIHGLVRDAEGQKMSKSKGNILDPLDLIDGISLEALIEKRTTGLLRPRDAAGIETATRRQFPDGIQGYGTDALRFTFASLASPGRNINFDVGRIGGHRNFCNKLWNAARYVLMSAGDEALLRVDGDIQFGAPERWIRSRLGAAIGTTADAIRAYRFDLAAQAIQSFTWDEYCDWYLELSKPVLTDDRFDPARKRGTRFTLLSVLEALLRLSHPFMPFITEEIWQQVGRRCGRSGATIMLQPYPVPDEWPRDSGAEREISWLMAFVLGIRRIRGEMNIAPGRALPVLVHGGSREERQWLDDNLNYLLSLARLERIRRSESIVADAAAALAGDMTLYIPLAELIDPRAEVERLRRDLQSRESDLQRIRHKLASGGFVERAPREIVEKERRRHDELTDIISRLHQQIGNLEGLQTPDTESQATGSEDVRKT